MLVMFITYCSKILIQMTINWYRIIHERKKKVKWMLIRVLNLFEFILACLEEC